MEYQMITYRNSLIPALGLLLFSLGSTAFSQAPASGEKDKKSDKEHMTAMDKMSSADKARIIDKMSKKDMHAMKIAGWEKDTMTEQEHSAAMAKMTEQEKSDMFDKLPSDKRTALMRKNSKGQKVSEKPKD